MPSKSRTLEVQSVTDRRELCHMLLRVVARSSCRAGSVALSGRLSKVDMVTDAPGLEADTKLIRRGRRGVRNGESSATCELDRRA
jgi:hypothetical protein